MPRAATLPSARFRPAVLAALLLALAGCSAPAARAPTAPEPPGHRVAGYLPPDAVPDSLLLVPAPPQAGSAAAALDDTVNREALALRGSARWQQASRDAELGFPAGAQQFSCALGIDIDPAQTPHLYQLLSRVRADAGAATRTAKQRYQRPRPFMVNHQPTCTPDDEAGLRGNGSYPSGHTSIGWAWALVLSEIDPANADRLLARGRNYGESRLVCNVHWQSDVLQGRFMGAAAVARLHGSAEFRRDLEAARSEIAAARAGGLKPSRDCAAEAAALQVRPASAL
ncbi:phosphatase PAP2 family protein [Stenotrophomonas sp. MMGLT7]|uniref:acid phosphatase n=1 Tax=Stenotrophomonas sp. MMGLT7 TaxID=2901227 RepID=UPI001E492BFB|nr:phosphatase PAP2 family protein [Stenotrophomonas sp. MMGLT7]MCD7098571.1 phosphatase PAP2 family protein [Stenotrophomonas sp. MMGLT7]